MHSEVPYISVVALAPIGANGETVRSFVKSWTLGAARHGLPSELIVVVPGPADGDERLRAANPEGSVVRVVETPSGVYPTTARNVGIRRARGAFILSTDIAIAFSDELMQFLAARRLQKGHLYRIDRHDIAESGTAITLHAREGRFPLSPDGLRENQPEDIAGVASGIHFGEGWFPAERDANTGEVFRWIGRFGEVVLRTPASGGLLALEFEAGPGVGPVPQVLEVLDHSGARVAEWTVSGRVSMRLWVPPALHGELQTFSLSAPDGGRALLHDLRILDFRFFRCDWAADGNSGARAPRHGRVLHNSRSTLTRLAVGAVRNMGIGSVAFRALPALRGTRRLLNSVGEDIFGAGIEYWGRGWHRLEDSGTEMFRWVSSDAELVVRIAGEPQCLSLLLEPGPSLGGKAFHLLIRLRSGKIAAKVPVSGLTWIRIPLPLAVGTIATLLLSPDTQGEAIPGDSRVLNFRVLACACQELGHVIPPSGVENPSDWASATAAEAPGGIDWASQVKGAQRELSEIGKPAFLHVNGCDFILMDRDSWFNVRGYPETEDAAENLSALLCYTAHFVAATEVVLRQPLRIDRRTAGERASAGSDEGLVWLITQMRRLHAPAILNLESWGMAGASLHESGAVDPVHAHGREE